MSSLFSLTEAMPPDVAVEIASDHVAAATVDRRGGQVVVSSYGIELLPPGALVPSLTAANAHDRAAVVTALNRALERVGRPRRIGLIVPDVIAKVSLVRFEKLPARASDLDQLVRWQVRKTAPFPIEEAQVSYVRGFKADDGQEFVVSLARRAVIEEYEKLCAEAGAYAGIVDLSTFNAINAILASGGAPAGDWLVVTIAADSASIAILRGDALIFFRNRSAEADGTLADLVHQTAMYYEDRLQGSGFARVLLAGAAAAGAHAGDLEVVRRGLQDRLAAPVDAVDFRSAATLADRITASPSLLDALAAPVGLLLRDRQRETVKA